MSKFVRNVALYLLVIIVAVTVVDSFIGNKTDKSEITYTNFLTQVQQKKVDSVQITADHSITGQLKDGSSFTTYAPTDAALMPALKDSDVNVVDECSGIYCACFDSCRRIFLLHAADARWRKPSDELRKESCQNARRR